MYVVKFIGIILVSFTGASIGFFQSNKLILRVKFLESYISLVRYIETEVRYCASSIIQILENYFSENKIGIIDSCIKHTYEDIPFSQAWCLAVDESCKRYYLKKEDISLIKDFGNGLGISDIDGQVAHCESNIELINIRLAEARDERKKKYRLYQTLGISGGLCLALLLI